MAAFLNENISVCCTCGAEWRTGHDGSHSCTDKMAKSIKELKLELKHLAYDHGMMILDRNEKARLLKSCEKALHDRDYPTT